MHSGPFFSAAFRLSLLLAFSFVLSGCSVEASKPDVSTTKTAPGAEISAKEPSAPRGATIEIKANSPADTVRVFYKHLRENRFREAIFLTNLRPAVEGLTDNELKEFQVDFEAIARQIPQEVEINGEIITGDSATVTAKVPVEDSDERDTQVISLRNENGVWVILTVDEAAEKKIKQEGKNYFYALRIETHEQEARTMLDRISKAQIVHSVQNGAKFGDLASLVKAGLLPEDAQSSESTGYSYHVEVSADGRQYTASAVPAAYGKTGKLSFLVTADGKTAPKLTSKDNGGKRISK